MKTSFKAVSVVLLAACMLVVGCATGPNAVVTNTCNTSKVVVPIAISGVFQYAVTQPEQQAEIKNQLFAVSTAVATLTTNGNVTISDVTAAFHTTNPMVNLMLQPVVSFLQVALAQLQVSNTAANQTMQILQCISSDVSSATQPDAVREAEAEGELLARRMAEHKKTLQRK